MDAPQKSQLFLGDRCAERRHRSCEAGLDEGDDIHVALGHDQLLAAPRRFPRRPMIEQAPALVENLRLRRVEVLGPRRRVHCPTAEGDHPPSSVPDRKDDPSSKPVVRLPISLRGQTGIDDQHLVNAAGRQRLDDAAPGVRRKSHLPALQRLRFQPATSQIFPCSAGSRRLKLQAVVPDRLFHDVSKLTAPVRLLLRLRIPLRDRHPGLPREDFHRLHETHVLRLAHEGDGVALRVAAKAVVVALAIVDVKACGLLLMEGARRP